MPSHTRVCSPAASGPFSGVATTVEPCSTWSSAFTGPRVSVKRSDTPPGFAAEKATVEGANAASVSSIANGTLAKAVFPLAAVAASWIVYCPNGTPAVGVKVNDCAPASFVSEKSDESTCPFASTNDAATLAGAVSVYEISVESSAGSPPGATRLGAAVACSNDSRLEPAPSEPVPGRAPGVAIVQVYRCGGAVVASQVQ